MPPPRLGEYFFGIQAVVLRVINGVSDSQMANFAEGILECDIPKEIITSRMFPPNSQYLDFSNLSSDVLYT